MSDNILTDYRDAVRAATALRAKAQKELQTTFTALLTDAAQIATEYRADFGSNPETPAIVKTFTINADAKIAKKRTPKTTEPVAAAPASAVTATTAEAPTVQISGQKLGGLKRSFSSLTGKIAEAKAAGKSTKTLEDKLYEVTDELTLAGVDITTLTAEAEVAPEAAETLAPIPAMVLPPPSEFAPAVQPF